MDDTMDTGADHAIIVCTRCRDPQDGVFAAARLLPRLEGAAELAGFSIETVGCMAGCGRPLTVGFRAEGKATFLFGDIDPLHDAAALADFARLYRSLEDGWCNEGQRPAGLKGKTLARIPARTGA